MAEWLLGSIGELIIEAFYTLFVSLVQVIASWAAMTVTWTLGIAFDLTQPDLSQSFIVTWGSRLFTVSLPIIVVMGGVQLAVAALSTRGEMHGAGVVVKGAAEAIVGTALALPILQLVNAAVDGVCNGFLTLMFADSVDGLTSWPSLFKLDELSGWENTTSAFIENPTEATVSVDPTVWGRTAGAVSNAAVANVGPLLGLVLVASSISIIAGLILLVVLGLRTAALYIAVVAAPIILMGRVYGPTRGWANKWLGLVFALLFSKIAIVVVVGMGIKAMTTLGSNDNLVGVTSNALVGCAFLIVACMMPRKMMGFFQFMAGEMGSHPAVSSSGGAASSVGRTAVGEISRMGVIAASGGTGAVAGAASKAVTATKAAHTSQKSGGSAGGTSGSSTGSKGSSSGPSSGGGPGSSAGPAGTGSHAGPASSSGGQGSVNATGGVPGGSKQDAGGGHSSSAGYLPPPPSGNAGDKAGEQ